MQFDLKIQCTSPWSICLQLINGSFSPIILPKLTRLIMLVFLSCCTHIKSKKKRYRFTESKMETAIGFTVTQKDLEIPWCVTLEIFNLSCSYFVKNLMVYRICCLASRENIFLVQNLAFTLVDYCNYLVTLGLFYPFYLFTSMFFFPKHLALKSLG